MAEELTTEDVESYTQGRVEGDEAQRMLDAALNRARNFVGWHVSPVIEDTFTLRGTGHDFIVLPTLKIVEIDSITEDGQAVDVADTYQLTDEPGILYKKSGYWCRDVITIELSHGFAAADAAAFREAVLQLIDSTLSGLGTGGFGPTGPLTEKKVDDVSLQWAGNSAGEAVARSPLNESALYQYRLGIGVK